MTYNLNKTIL